MEWVVNQQVKLGFVGSTTGLSTFADLTFLKNGVVYAQSFTTSEVGNKLYVVTFTPTTTGVYTLFVNGQIQATIEVVTKTLQTLATDLLDEALGSWTWNKTTGVLTLLRQSGSQLATYTVVDNSTTASRELN